MSDPGKAVFLSYASQDAEAAKHICDALRAAGVEVWFDAEGGLEHGDEWDAKIRRQIKDCVLFLPIISANTQAREEGYFRIEWELAAQRALGIASGVAFILPIVIDDTREPDALVPDRFRTVQWTRLRGGELTPEVKARFLKLWSHRAGMMSHQGGTSEQKSEVRGQSLPTASITKPGWKAYTGLAAAIFALVAVTGWWLLRRPAPADSTSAIVKSATPAPRVSEARQLADRARAMSLDKYDSSIDDFTAAEGLVKRALELDPNDGEIWAVSSLVNFAFNSRGFERTPARNAAARAHAERALKLAPDSVEALFALARWQRDGEEPAIAEANFLKILARQPDHLGALHNLGYLYDRLDRIDEAAALYAREAKNPAAAALAGFTEYLMYFRRARFAEAEQAVRKSIAVEPSSNAQSGLALLLLTWKGDAEAAAAAVATGPATIHREHRPIWVTAFAHLCRRQPADTLRVLERLPDEYILDNMYTGPKAYWVGLAHAQAGREAAARVAWEAGLALVDQRLRNTPADYQLRLARGELLAWLGREAEALQEVRTLEQLAFREQSWIFTPARIYAALGRVDDALKVIEPQLQFTRDHHNLGWPLTPALLRIDPRWDKLRGDPRFQTLCTEPAVPSPSSLSPFTPPDAKSVAVLAFANLSSDREQEYFSDGISEELLNVLAKIPGLKVSARTSAFYFKGKEVPIPEIARQLGVAYIVEGSVRKQGDKVRITAQLIKAADGFHVWSDTFTRDMKDIFAVQDEIAGKIATSLMDKLGVTVPTLAKTTPEAYTLYLQARATLAKRGVENLRESVKQFEAVVALDPDYLPARSGLARALSLIPSWTRSIALGANREGLERATQGARLVIEREPDNAEAWSALGYIIGLYDWRWREAGEAVARSLALAPNDAEIVNFAGDYYRFTLDPQKLIEMEKRAVELNPLQAINHMDVAFAYLALGQYELAIAPARTTISLAPDLIDSYDALVRAFGHLKRFDEMHAAIAAARKVEAANPAVLLNLEFLAAMFEGRTGDALRLQEEFRPQVEQGGYSPTEYGYHYLLLGQPEKALYWLKLGCQGHDAIMVSGESIDLAAIAANPVTRTVLDDPGLKELLEIRARHAAQQP